MNQFDRALPEAERAMTLAQRGDDKQQLARVLQVIGVAQRYSGASGSARKTLYHCVEPARRGDYYDTLFSAYFHIWQLDRETGERGIGGIERILRSMLTKLDEPLEEAEVFKGMGGGEEQ